MNDEQVERVAKAIAEWFACPWPFLLDAQREGYRSEARVAIAAMQPDAQAIRNTALREAAAIARDKHEAAITWASVHVKSFDGKTDSLLIAEEIEALLNKESTDG